MGRACRVLAAFVLLGGACRAADDRVFVSPSGGDAFEGTPARPVRTVNRAVELSRSESRKTIVLADGEYPMESSVELGSEDAGLSICAEHPGRVTLTSASEVGGWVADAADPRIVAAPFPFAPEEWQMPTLIVNGRVADLAAYPSYGGPERMRYFAEAADVERQNYTVLRYDPNDLPEGTDFRDLDISSAFLYVPQEYCSTLCRIATNDWKSECFHLRDRTAMPIGQFNQGYQVVNTRQGMNRPGCWMFEAAKRRIVYRLREGESAATLKATISWGERLFNLTATHDIRFEGLVLEGCSAPFRRGKGKLPAACIAGDVVTNVVVDSCEIRNSSGDGINFDREGKVAVRRCHFHDLGGSGIWLGYFGEVGEISDCHIHHNGRLTFGAAGAWAHMMRMTVVRNHVHDQPGCGLTLWTSDSLIASNHLHRTMTVIRDGGGLYGAQNFSMVRDNWCHDNGDWPGLYNDEGGRDTVYTGNRFDGDWWPFHMHDTQGVVITNNVFTCDGCAMRFCFQGSAHAVFRDNVINTTIPVEDDAYLDNCDVWADNDIRLKQADGSYKSVGRLSLVKRPATPKPPAAVIAQPGAGLIFLDRDVRGFASPGVPGARAKLSSDGTNLCVEGFYEYNKFISYKGSVNLGETWGRHDAVRFFFDGFTVTAFVGGSVVSSDPTLTLDPATTYSEKMKSVGDGWARFGFRIPLARLGDRSFNAVSFNADHCEYKYFTPPCGLNKASGRLVLKPYAVDLCARTPAKASSFPGGAAHFVAEWVEKRPELKGFALTDAAAHRGFLLQPFTGADPEGEDALFRPAEMASESAHPDCYGISVENWALRTETTASKGAAYLKASYDRGGIVKMLLESSEGNFEDEGKTFTGRDGDLFAALSFDPKPRTVRPLTKGSRRRWVLEFFVKPIVGAVTVRAAVSGESAAEASARLGSEPDGADFNAIRAACHKAWNAVLPKGANFNNKEEK